MDRRALIAIILVGLIWAGWAAVYYPSQGEKSGAESPTATELAAGSTTPTAGGATPVVGMTPVPTGDATPVATQIPEHATTLDSETLVVRLTNLGARPVDVQLKDYRAKLGEDPYITLFGDQDEYGKPKFAPLSPMFLHGDENMLPVETRFEVVEETESLVRYRYTSSTLNITRSYELDPENYTLRFTETYENASSSDVRGSVAIGWYERLKGGGKKKGGLFSRLPDEFNPSVVTDGKLVRKASKGVGKVKQVGDGAEQTVSWFGIDDRYFIAALIPIDPLIAPGEGAAATITTLRPTQELVGIRATFPPIELAPGESRTYTYDLFVGPKEYKLLHGVGHELEASLALGRFIGKIATGLLIVLKKFHGFTSHWGVAIVLMTLVIKLILLPLTHKSMKMMRENSVKMQAVQPELDRLKTRYADDKDKLNQETMALFKKRGVNPLSTLGGCIPMLLQMPIWFALYRVLYSSIDLRHAPLFGWVHDLSAPDPFYVLPLFLGVVMFVQQLVMPQPTAGAQNEMQMKIMKWAMPVMFTFIMLNLPSGLVLYIFVNTCLSIVQSLYINKTMPTAGAPAPAKT